MKRLNNNDIDLLDKPNSSKWAALLLAPLTTNPITARPRFHSPTFLASLQASLIPVQTAHYYVTRHPSLPLTLIRVSLHDPHAAPVYPERKRIFWLGFPAGGDHIFTTLGNTQRGAGEVVVSGVAHAVSRSGCRFELKPGRLQARTLESMCSLRGAEGASGGMAAGWGVYVEGFEDSPLALPKDELDDKEEEGEMLLDPQARKRRKLVKTRFGNTGVGDGAALESAYFEVAEKFPEDPELAREGQTGNNDGKGTFVPKLGIKFDGTHIFAGIREMAEEGEGIDVMTLPGWMTGEEAVSSGVVRNGKVIRKKGAGRFSKA
jgi:central kinetochore subunit Mis15/CHL4